MVHSKNLSSTLGCQNFDLFNLIKNLEVPAQGQFRYMSEFGVVVFKSKSNNIFQISFHKQFKLFYISSLLRITFHKRNDAVKKIKYVRLENISGIKRLRNSLKFHNFGKFKQNGAVKKIFVRLKRFFAP